MRSLALTVVNEHLSDLMSMASERSVTLNAEDGRPLVRLKLLHAAALAAAGVIVAPRITAAAALGALFKGLSLSLDPEPAD